MANTRNIVKEYYTKEDYQADRTAMLLLNNMIIEHTADINNNEGLLVEYRPLTAEDTTLCNIIYVTFTQ